MLDQLNITHDSFSMADFVPPELVSSIYCALDPTVEEDNKTLLWLLKNDLCVQLYPDIILDFCARRLFSVEQKCGESREDKGRRFYKKALNALSWMGVVWEGRTGSDFALSLRFLAGRRYDVVFEQIVAEALGYTKGMQDIYSRITKDIKHRESLRCTNICLSIARHFPVPRECGKLPFHLSCVIDTRYHALLKRQEFMALIPDRKDVIDALSRLSDNALTRDTKPPSAPVIDTLMEKLLEHDEKIPGLFITIIPVADNWIWHRIAISFISKRLVFDDAMLEHVGKYYRAFELYKALDDMGFLNGALHPTRYLVGYGLDCCRECLEYPWKCNVAGNEAKCLDTILLELARRAQGYGGGCDWMPSDVKQLVVQHRGRVEEISMSMEYKLLL